MSPGGATVTVAPPGLFLFLALYPRGLRPWLTTAAPPRLKGLSHSDLSLHWDRLSGFPGDAVSPADCYNLV